MAKNKTPKDSEVHAYHFIKDQLKLLGWDIRNPERAEAGEVWTQNEGRHNDDIKSSLGRLMPENIVKVSERILWIIEAKRDHNELEKALYEAEYDYAAKFKNSRRYKVQFISGVAGNPIDSYLIRTKYFNGKKFVPVTLNDVEATGLLSKRDLLRIVETGTPDIAEPEIDERLFISRAEHINRILHLGAVNPHQRAGVMAALLLSMLSHTLPNIDERNPTILINDINGRVQSILRDQEKPGFYEYIKINLPSTSDNHVKLRKALVDTLQELNNLNIRSAMNSGADWLGAFYEVFLKYANWAQDLGIVLTPRHITRWVADVMDVQVNDIVYDPTCGTGGFLVAAFDYVKKNANARQLARFKQNSVFGVEQDAGVAALAVINMIFRGDGKNNIKEGNCFVQHLAPTTEKRISTAKYNDKPCDNPPVTKVMMNPPFALKRSDEKEFKFIDKALAEMQDGGVLFSVLPYSVMVKPGIYQTWRKRSLLANHTLLAVVTFPIDVFYPVGITTVGVFIKKGIPHPKDQKVLWVRALNDGLLKSKGKRLPNPKAINDLATVQDVVKAFIHNPGYRARNIHQFQRAMPVDFTDESLELVPEAYLSQARPSEEEICQGLDTNIRNTLAYLIKIDHALIEPGLFKSSMIQRRKRPHSWKSFRVEDIFELHRGHFHSIADLEPGDLPTISRISTDNGFVGFYEMPANAAVWEAKLITVSTVTGDAFVQPIPFIATDNVVVCKPRPEYKDISLESRFFISQILNMVKWRYSYGRQCYKNKFAKTEIMLPINKSGRLDYSYMDSLLMNIKYWNLIKNITNQEARDN